MSRPKARVLVVDDEQHFRENLADFLSSQGYEVLQAPDAGRAMALASQRSVDVAAVDMVMPKKGGLALLAELKELDPLVQVIVMTGKGTIETAVDAMRKGAFDFVAKPVRMAEIEAVVRRALDHASLARENRAYRELQRRHRLRVAGVVVAKSPAMRVVLEEAVQLGQADFPVLIQGETGTGKEVVAEHIHANSDRRDLPMTVLNCAAIPDALVDSELFGHEKGAFTGADQTRPGMIEIANRGTLLLDEIGDLPAPAQGRMLRFLESGVYRPVGGRIERAVDVRVLAATNHSLRDDVESGGFRDDLFHRLNVYRLTVPPLRERLEGIEAIAHSVLHRLNRQFRSELTISRAAGEALRRHGWPGNVRELIHSIERAAFTCRMAGASTIAVEHLALTHEKAGQEVQVSLEEAGKRHIQAVLRSVGGSKREAARILGISERHLYRLLKRETIPPPAAEASDL